MKVERERLILYSLNNEEMKAMIEKENDPEMEQAYMEMLEGCLSNPRERMWHTAWNMELKNGTGKIVGDFCFKGIGNDGVVEIGYGEGIRVILDGIC